MRCAAPPNASCMATCATACPCKAAAMALTGCSKSTTALNGGGIDLTPGLTADVQGDWASKKLNDGATLTANAATSTSLVRNADGTVSAQLTYTLEGKEVNGNFTIKDNKVSVEFSE